MSVAAFVAAILSSSFLAAVVTGFVTSKNNSKNMSLKYITEERAVWRKNIKEATAKLYTETLEGNPSESSIRELVTFLILNLNPQVKPKNKLDHEIVKLLKKIENQTTREKTDPETLRDMVSVLMKHDWERSKNETKGFFSKAFDEKIEQDTLGEYYVPTSQRETE